MAVSPTPGQLEYTHDNATERSVNMSFVLQEPERFDSYFWMGILTLLIVILGLVGNSIVLWLLGFRIQRNPFSVYILNLAGADALFLCSSFLNYMNYVFEFSSSRLIHVAESFLLYVFFITSMNLLAAISIERCLSVLFPIWYLCHRPKHTSATLCTVLWALVILFGALYCKLCWGKFSDPICRNTINILLFVWSIVLTCMLCVSNLTLLLRVQCSPQHQQPPRLYLLVLLTVLVFLLCLLPIGISDFIGFKTNIYYLPYWLRSMLACVNSSANPIIYFFLGNQRCRRREPLRVILQRALGNEEVRGGTTGTPHTNAPETSF
ncbi:mas-related G-protein coupled receptor member A6-like [Notamacropus eugenii]|uniref:mas-related G-protein coupled receptor member A6-like n=1 Tax=Notamacropus eugenii TaxID=9315 RepID=UPI003B67474E